MLLKNIFKKSLALLLLFLGLAFGFSQEAFRKFYHDMDERYPNERLLKKAQQGFLKAYQKNKNGQDLAFAKILDIVYIKPGDSVKNLRAAYEIIQQTKPETAARAEGYFFTAIFLEKSSLDLSRSYLLKAIDINLRNNNNFLLPMNYHILGRNYYLRKQYPEAIAYFKKALHYFLKQGELTHISSMYNNFGLSYAQMKNYPLAIQNTKKSIRLLLKIKQRKYYQDMFLHTVIGNLGDYYYSSKQYSAALSCYEKAFGFSLQNPYSKQGLADIVSKMYALYQNDALKQKLFLQNLRGLLDQDPNNALNVESLKLLLEKAIEEGNLGEIKTLTVQLNDFRDLYRNSLLKKQRQTTDDLNRYLIASLESEQEAGLQKEKLTLVGFSGALALLALGLFYLFKINKANKEKAFIKSQLLEREKTMALERLQHAQLNLDLKSKTEEAFLQRIRLLRKEKNLNAEETIKDLQLSISSLLSIDKKQETEIQKKDLLDDGFLQQMAQDFPHLSALDLQLCGYVHLSLSNKEIAQLQNVTPPSVRVYKTRLKAKLGLTKEQELETFLKNLKR